MDWNFVTHAAPLPSSLPKILALIFPFDSYVWGCFFISFVIISFTLYLLSKLIKNTIRPDLLPRIPSLGY